MGGQSGDPMKSDIDTVEYKKLPQSERDRFESSCATFGMAASDFEVRVVRPSASGSPRGAPLAVAVTRLSNGACREYPAGIQHDWPAAFDRELDNGRFG